MSDIPLLPGVQAFPDALWSRFARGEQVADLAEVGGAIHLVGFDQGDHWVVATAGLSRIPLTEGERTEFWMEVLPEQVGAAVVVLEIVIREIIQNDQVMWGPGKVWMNSQVLLEGTGMQALAVSPFDDGVVEVREEAQFIGYLRELLLLTKAEARSLALDGPDALAAARAADRAVLRDVERDDAASSRSLPDVPCMVSLMVRDQPPRWVECDEQGRFIAFTGDEPPGYLDDPDNLELWALSSLAEHSAPEVTDFLLDADPGEFLTDHGDHWHRGHLSELEDSGQSHR